MSKVTMVIQKWAQPKLFLKDQAEVAYMFIAFIIYSLSIMPCPSLHLTV